MKRGALERHQLLEVLDSEDSPPELAQFLDSYLAQYVHTLDSEMVGKLLKAGASADAEHDVDCYLCFLLHEYEVGKTLSGESALATMNVLLEAGANPNRVALNNLRAYDLAVVRGAERVAFLLREHGAMPEVRNAV